MSKRQLLQSLRRAHEGNDAGVQRDRILEVLKRGYALTTLEARRDLNILMPATRVFELREAGHPVEKVMVDAMTDAGVRHKVAKYFMAKPSTKGGGR